MRQIEVRLTPRWVNLENMMSEKSIKQLHAFLEYTHGEVRAIHPNDEDKLNEFIWTLHREGSEFNVDLFNRILEEGNGWPEDLAQNLGDRIDTGLTLLRYQPVTN